VNASWKPVKDALPVTSSARRIFEIVMWSSISNLVLLGCFIAGWNNEVIRSALGMGPPRLSVAQLAVNPVMLSGHGRGDNELSTLGPQRQLKGALQITVVEQAAAETPQEAADVAEAPLEDITSAGEGDFGEDEVGPEGRGAQSMRPVLRAGQKGGDLEIGNFETVSLEGDATECLAVGYELLSDVGAANSQLEVLASTSSIVMARICAINGSVVITCRSDQITISPRRLKPNETCAS